ncbi:hypothetical protein ABZ723_22765 [Streptomyces sp. NPDC006700]|uniref:hypothetical protein n=1 Tax=Streptomyces sp. NPDC006700 TaxID=3154479 RepID=UPI0033FCA73B
MESCGCGEEQIPWVLAEFGLFATVGLVLTVGVVILLAGWLLATAKWLIRNRVRRPRRGTTESAPAPTTTSESPRDGSLLSGFTWRYEDP